MPVAEGWKVKYSGQEVSRVSEAKRLPELEEEKRQLEAPGRRVDAGNRALKDWHLHPLTPHQQVMPANYTHAGLIPRRECSDSSLVELSGA